MSGPLWVDIAGTELTAEDREILQHPAVAGVILFTRNYANAAQLAALTASIRALRPELLLSADYEGGRVQRFRDGFTRIPPMRALGRVHDRDADAACADARDMGWLIGAELGAVGIDLPFAPVLDLDYGRARVIGDRALHSDPAVVIALAAAFQAGLADAGAAATIKHFPGHGAVAEDSHEALPVDDRDVAQLVADIKPFAALIARGTPSVMMAHIRYPAVDAAPASLSRAWIGERLRGDLGFTGAVFCDDLSMGGAAAVGDYPQRAAQALAAGCDILPVCNNRAAVAALLDDLPDWRDPQRAVRLQPLRHGGSWQRNALAGSSRWRTASARAAELVNATGGNA